MTRTRRGPAPDRTGPQEAATRKPHRQRSADDDRQPTAGELLRRLADHVLAAVDPTDAVARLGESAEAAALLVARGRVTKLSAAVALVTTAQAAGVPLAVAEGVVREALQAAP